MLNVVITESGIESVKGVPDYFVDDVVLNELCNNQEMAKSVYNFFGRNVCIGRLGSRISDDEDVFEEHHVDIPQIKSEKGIFCYYEKV